MAKIVALTGQGISLRGNDIDTDRIIPARYLKAVTFDGLGDAVFADDRQAQGGQHPFDLPQYQGATLLVVNRNFGCGSSREHAPQAIARWGVQGILGESFAEIFLGNCSAIGIPCLTADTATVEAVQTAIEQQPDQAFTLDLVELTLSGVDQRWDISMADNLRQTFLEGTWDACGQLTANAAAIAATASRLPYLGWQATGH